MVLCLLATRSISVSLFISYNVPLTIEGSPNILLFTYVDERKGNEVAYVADFLHAT